MLYVEENQRTNFLNLVACNVSDISIEKDSYLLKQYVR